jgi:8-amino-7-oxononanoate synthase
VRHFFNQVTSHPSWDAVNDEGILRIPVADDHESRPFVSHIVPLRTRVGDEKHLSRHLLLIANANAYAISFPIVPKNKTRVRLVFHAHNSLAEVEKLAGHVMDWADEMLRIDEEGDDEVLPQATRMYQALEVAA